MAGHQESGDNDKTLSEVGCPEPVEGHRIDFAATNVAAALMAGQQDSGDNSKVLSEVECPEPVEGLFWVYILQCEDGSFYVGYSKNVEERLRKHRYGLGSKHTHDRKLLRLVYVEPQTSAGDAGTRESQIKRWSRAKKMALVMGDITELKRLSGSRQ